MESDAPAAVVDLPFHIERFSRIACERRSGKRDGEREKSAKGLAMDRLSWRPSDAVT